MPDNVIEHVIRINGQQAETTLQNVADSAVKTNAALAATSRLEILSARGGSEIERAALAYRMMSQEVKALTAAGGDARLAAQVMERAQAQLAATVARTNMVLTEQPVAAAKATAAMHSIERSSGMARAGLFSLGQQVQDVGVMLAGGMSPFSILVTQGPQIATAVGQMGGLSAAIKMVGTSVAAAGPLLAYLAVAIAAVGTAYAVFSNATTNATTEARDHNRALVDQALAAARTQGEVDKLTASWAKYLDKSADINNQLGIINGTLDKTAVAAERAAKAIRDAAKETLTAQGADVGRLQVALAAAESLAADRGAGAAARATASGEAMVLRERLQAAERVLAATRAQVDADAEGAASLAEYNAETAKSEEFLRAREAALRAQQKAADEAARAWDRYFASVVRAKEIAEAAARADRVIEASRATDDLTRQWALYGDQLERAGAVAAASESDRKAAQNEETARLMGLVAGMEQYTAATVEAANAWEKAAAGAQGGAGIVQGGVNGLMRVVQQMGPVGQIVGAVVEIVANIERFLTGVHEFVVSFADTVERLPDILADSIVQSLQGFDLFSDALDGFIRGLMERMPEIVGAMLETIPRSVGMIIDLLVVKVPELMFAFMSMLLDPNTWIQVATAFIKAIVEAVGKIGGGLLGLGDREQANAARRRNGERTSFGEWWASLDDGWQSSVDSGRASSSGSSRSRSTARHSSTTNVFQGPVLGLGVEGASTIASEMVSRGFMRRPE